jgi:organic hydroperoxide reductase OsmC/OhrA
MERQHEYRISIEWTGNRGTGTSSYTAYDRSHNISGEHKVMIEASSDPCFRGDINKYNPEELLVASLVSCHMLWFLHLCAVEGVVVTKYTDTATGTLRENGDGGGCFEKVTLHPKVVVADQSMIEMANMLHKKAHTLCFIANSVNFEVTHEPIYSVG